MDWLAQLGDALAREHAAAAVSLYGSHARGDARTESDVDALILVPTIDGSGLERSRDSRRYACDDGTTRDLDGWLKPWDPKRPTHGFDLPADPGLLRPPTGRALHDTGRNVSANLAAIDRALYEGPTPLAEDEREALLLCKLRRTREREGRPSVAT